MITVYINSSDTTTYKRIHYVMTQILVPIGFQFTILGWEGKISDTFSIACVSEKAVDEHLSLQNFDLVIYYGDYTRWVLNNENIELAILDGIPVLYIDRMPKFLIHDGKVGFDLINVVFYLLSRQEEYTYKHRDLWDCFAAPYSILYEKGILREPVINYYIKHLESYIRQKIQDIPEPKWKNGAPYAAIISHDLDHLPSKDATIPLNFAFRRKGKSGIANNLLSSAKELVSLFNLPKPNWTFEYWIQKEKEYGFHSTFFVAGNTKYRHHDDPTYWINSKLAYNGKSLTISNVAKNIEVDGWEIGLHASMNTYKDRQLLSREMEILRENTNCNVVGIRHHYLRFDVSNTWQIHEDLGFLYDSTMGYNERIGFRSGMAFPFNPYNFENEREYNLLELSLCIMDSNLNTPVGEKLDVEKSIQRCYSLMDLIKQSSGLLTVNFHPHFFVIPYPDWWKVYESILRRLAEDGAYIATGREIAENWNERRKRIAR
jgi:hypothetical protein